MVPRLNEDVLMKIFRATTPLEKVQIYQVCTEWKDIVSKLMKKHNRLCLYDADDRLWDYPKFEPISAEIAKELILYTAPFIEDLLLEVYETNATKYRIKIDQFEYLVKDSNINEIIKILAENTSKITCIELHEVASDSYSDLEPFKNLFKRNKIKKVLAGDSWSLRTLSVNDLIQEITELNWFISLKCWPKCDHPSIHHFGLLHSCPNLQKLIVFGYGSLFDVAQVVFHDLQYCKNLKSFKLGEHCNVPLPLECSTSNIIHAIVSQVPHLEELAFFSNHMDIDFELAQMMAVNLTNLRSFTIWRYENQCNDAMSWYMSIPQLKKLHVCLDPSFSPTNFPECAHLSECYILFVIKDAVPSTYTSIICLFQKMPNLQKFGFTQLDVLGHSECKEKPFGWYALHDVIFQFIIFAVSEYQTVMISVEANERTSFSRKMKIERKGTEFSSKEMKSLDFSFTLYYTFVKSFMTKLTEYCNKNLKGHTLQLIPERRRDEHDGIWAYVKKL